MPVIRPRFPGALTGQNTALTGQGCRPCMLYRSPTLASAGANLKLLSGQSLHKQFIDTYRLLPQSDEELVALLSGKWNQKRLLTKPITSGELQTFAFNYVGMINGRPFPQENIYTDIFKDRGVAKIFLPGEYTPTCDGTHLPSYLDENVLRGLKKAGIDVLVFVTPGKQDSLCRWLRDALHEKGLDKLMPDALPTQNLEARLSMNRAMPVIVGQACPGLEDINAHGLVIGKNRLGLTSHRAVAVYDPQGTLRLMVKAPNPSQEMCTPTLASSMLEEIQKLKLNAPKVLPRL